MTDKTGKIVEAAATLFARYGFSKTTMGDIAAEAGVARQTVYNAFPGKDEILRAVVRVVGDASLANAQSAWRAVDDFSAKLDAFHVHAPLAWYIAIKNSPDMAETLEGMHRAAAEESAEVDRKFKAALRCEVFILPSHSEDDLNEAMDFFYAASLNAKHGATSEAHLVQRLGTIRKATVALLG